MGLREIARELNNKRISTVKGGGRCHGRTIKYILENLLYKGNTHYKSNKVKNKELALI